MLYNVAMVFAAHPDDEVMMAGTIAKMAAEGTRVVVVQMTDGSEGYPDIDMRHAIAEMRRREATACDLVLGIARRYHLDRPDMGLVNDKPTLQDAIRIIREEYPDVAFVHGDNTLHRDHIAQFQIAIEALWHAGGPVAAALGAPWATSEIYIYKDATTDKPPFAVPVGEYGRKFYESLATQESQYTLFTEYLGYDTRETLVREFERLIKESDRNTEYFWIARDVLGFTELPAREAHQLANWSAPVEA